MTATAARAHHPKGAPCYREFPLDVVWILGIIALAVVVALTAKGVEKL
ncbi:hypothetical protein ACFOYW_11690 [Gryllotalpicola reticulitermitis]|uniref:Uncharacterized protein n=1 Tax=Gryllotalpicola reticulitermitis TaxID=1184153 RepID=A0ABV8Q7Q4_9MICO